MLVQVGAVGSAERPIFRHVITNTFNELQRLARNEKSTDISNFLLDLLHCPLADPML